MAKKSIPQLKDKFQKGDKPMQEDFYDLLDSFIHRDEDISKILIKIASISEAENGSDNVKHMTPLLTKKAIYALTRLADIPDLATEVQQKIDASINSLLTLEDADNLINTVKDVLDFVQGAGEDLNIITELGKKVDKTSISHAIDSSSTTNVASSKAVRDAKNSARVNAANDVRGGIATAQDTLKKLYDWAVNLFNTKIDKTALSSNISSTSTTNVATSKAVNDAKNSAIKKVCDWVAGGFAKKNGSSNEDFKAQSFNVLPRKNDLNNVVVPFSAYSTSFFENSTANRPSFNYGLVVTQKWDTGNSLSQIAVKMYGTGMAIRGQDNNGLWEDWATIYHSRNANKNDVDWAAKNVTADDIIIR